MGQPAEVIECLDRSPETLVSRFPELGAASLPAGARLLVRDGQAAVLVRDGCVEQVLGVGAHALPEACAAPARAELYFASLRGFVNQKWAALEPIAFRDGELAELGLRAFGTWSFRVTDPARFMQELLAALSEFTNGAVSELLRGWIVTQLAEYLSSHLYSVLDLAQRYGEIAAGAQARIADHFAARGVTVVEFRLLSLSPPEPVQELIDRRAVRPGAAPASATVHCPACQCALPAEAAFCPSCGARRRSDSPPSAHFCASCGTRLPNGR
ncbi:MAG TPA: SPFH domain-containing protein [Myxococcota bacterium]|nr:SPFH domain-containing protein [Myxococcota bacterium]